MTGNELQEIFDALSLLGYRINSECSVTEIAHHRAEVHVGQEHIGVYDFDRHTFVD